MMEKNNLLLYGGLAAAAYFLFLRRGKAQLPGGSGSQYNPPADVSLPKLSNTEIQSIANTQLTAMADLGTNETLLINSIKNLNGADLVRVYNAFGTKSYAATGSWFGIGYPLDLFGWYSEELSGTTLSQMRSIWNKSGLTITF